jgi:hypothetical protein
MGRSSASTARELPLATRLDAKQSRSGEEDLVEVEEELEDIEERR